MSASITAPAFWKGGQVVVADSVVYHAKLRKAGFGEGEALVVRVEREEEAAKHGHYKHLFGHLLAPASEKTGYTVTELKADFKALYLPDGMTSLTEMSAVQFEDFNRSVEQHIREQFPSDAWDACVNAMALYDRSNA